MHVNTLHRLLKDKPEYLMYVRLG